MFWLFWQLVGVGVGCVCIGLALEIWRSIIEWIGDEGCADALWVAGFWGGLGVLFVLS
jgi:hypothetical protein